MESLMRSARCTVQIVLPRLPPWKGCEQGVECTWQRRWEEERPACGLWWSGPLEDLLQPHRWGVPLSLEQQEQIPLQLWCSDYTVLTIFPMLFFVSFAVGQKSLLSLEQSATLTSLDHSCLLETSLVSMVFSQLLCILKCWDLVQRLK